jgi:hypothetical protein
MKIKIESFTTPITEEILQKKDFGYPSGGVVVSGGGGDGGGEGGGEGGGNTNNNFNFNAGISNIFKFERQANGGALPQQFDFSYVANANKKGMMFVNIQAGVDGVDPLNPTPTYLQTEFFVNGERVGYIENDAYRLNTGGLMATACYVNAGFNLQNNNTISVKFSTNNEANLHFAFIQGFIMEI